LEIGEEGEKGTEIDCPYAGASGNIEDVFRARTDWREVEFAA